MWTNFQNLIKKTGSKNTNQSELDLQGSSDSYRVNPSSPDPKRRKNSIDLTNKYGQNPQNSQSRSFSMVQDNKRISQSAQKPSRSNSTIYNSSSRRQSSRDQNNRSSVPQQRNSIAKGLMGMQIIEDPAERDIYVPCPKCELQVFDSGLQGQLFCKNCEFSFKPNEDFGNESNADQSPFQDGSQEQDDEDNQPSPFDVVDEEEEEVKQYDNQNSSQSQSPDKQRTSSISKMEAIFNKSDAFLEKLVSKIDSKTSEVLSRKSQGSAVKKQPTNLDNLDQNQVSLFTPEKSGNQSRSAYEERKNFTDSSSKYVNELEQVVLFVVKETILQDFIDPQTNHTEYTLILNSILMPFFMMRTRILEKATYFKIGDIEFYVAATEPYDFGKITQNSIIRTCQTVQKQEPLQRINLVPLRRLETSRSVILQNVLKPYFDRNISQCLHKNQIVEIDDQEFFIKYSRPFFGAISNGTEVKIDSSMPKHLQVIRLATIWDSDEQYNEAVAHKEETFEMTKSQYVNPYFFSGLMCYVEKGETLIIANREFFINDCWPKSGVVDRQTQIELEVGFTRQVFQAKQVLADQRFAERIQSHDQSNNSYSQSQSYNRHQSSSADIFQESRLFEMLGQIDARQNDDRQVSQDSQQTDQQDQEQEQNQEVMSEDQRRLVQQAQQEGYTVMNAPNLHNNQESQEFQEFLREMMAQQAHYEEVYSMYMGGHRNATPKSIVDSLPIRNITTEFLEKQTEDSNRKCMICLTEYEDQQEIRTMPCLHYFHTECIDKWLLQRAKTCPVCKFNIKKNYNLTQAPQSSFTR